MGDDLDVCPVCGHEGKLIIYPVPEAGYSWYRVRCTKCGKETTI